ncbi:MAG: PQQ-dependent sugar dehydrogenase [Sporocytophaga sp.]|uniref:PQQ-dependent sugar dehydrogenase n=1 Tax=Sporocytophaga sp. TaxID=2231183 RepID=UPI001B17D2E4|nr:PQQ-dependent sugar dehydrogenase [Sporocytophaga sp.]MBO9700676.1 PQQ-dependent sugar dehydrogenase [Sporocytophaga sp.]
MTHQLKSLLKTGLALLLCLFSQLSIARDYEAPKAQTAPVIDGVGSDACWASANWYYIDQTWLGSTPTAADFSGRFKASWDSNKLYILGEITDDVLSDKTAAPLTNYWEDDCFEVLLDENKSGGEHEKNYNAFAYHISTLLDAVDVGVDGNPHLFNDHVTVKWTKNGNVYTWEVAITMYTDAFVYGATNNPKANLVANKKIGLAMAYCDNDGASSRDNFMGSEIVTGSDKNIAYKTADIFGTLTLVESSVPTASFVHSVVASNLANPTVMVCAPDGRIFVCEQEGKLRIIKNGNLLSTPAVTVQTAVYLPQFGNYSERGLIGLAFDPDFANNNYIYLYYTVNSNGIHNRVSRFTLNGDVVVSGSELVLLELETLSDQSVSHNGGAMAFGKDGKLYIATGENQQKVTPPVSQNLDNYFGKILRINSDGTAPADNPFPTGSEKRKRVWSYGLRNPFTFDIQPGTGKIFVNDVGQDAWEEINDVTIGGKNYGWPTAEGVSSNPDFTNPVYVYGHPTSDSTGCAITGGTFFNPETTNYPSKYIGKYFFMDYCNNWINFIDPANNFKRQTFSSNVAGAPIAIDAGIDGNIYYLSRSNSAVYKIVYSGNSSPEIVNQPQSANIFETQPVTFSVTLTGTAPFTYQWMKNGVDIPNSNSATYSIASTTTTDAGDYSVKVTNASGSVTSNIATLTVGPKNSKPVATILTPTNGTLYKGGDVITFSGSGTDPEDGTLPASSFTWFFNLHHNTHVHDGLPLTGIQNGTFTIPVSGETEDNVWFRIKLVVKDNLGLTDTTYVEIFPKKSTITLATEPAGLQVKVDGQPKTTPYSTLSVQGIERSISPVSPQSVNGIPYVFDHWVHGGSADQIISTPLTNTTYTAVFKKIYQDTSSYSPIHDAYVQNAKYDTTFKSKTYGTLDPQFLISKVLLPEGNNRNTFITFDISDYKDSILSAKLKLYGYIEETDTDKKSSIAVGVYTSSTNWTENTITWNNQPTISSVALDTTVVNGYTYNTYYWDVTKYIKSERAAGRTKITLVLKNIEQSFPRIYFNSKENTNGNGPKLMILAPCQGPALNATQTNATCYGGNNGTIAISATGGITPYQYSWTNASSTSSTATGLTAGDYKVTVTDNKGCYSTKTITITQPASIGIAIVKTDVSCFGGNNGSAVATASNGNTPFTYSWSPSGGTTATANTLTAGVYTLTVTDSKSCKATSTVTISEPEQLTAFASKSDVSCFGGNNGSATVAPTGGTSGYTFSWSPSGGTTATASNLSTGIYVCKITDAKSCFIEKSVTINGPSAALAATTSQKDVTCIDGSSGEATVTPSGGTSPYLYSWSPSGGSAAKATGLSAGVYTCRITDANGCKIQKSVTITSPSTLQASHVQMDVTCFGKSDGSVTVTAIGGGGNYSYSWSPVTGSTASLSGLSAGNYACTIKDDIGCSVTETVTINQPDAINATPIISNVSCFAAANGSVTLSPTGGTPAYTYAWTPSGGTSAVASNLAPGNYNVTIKDSKNCSITKSVTITQPLALEGTTEVTNAKCFADNSGSISVKITGGTSPYDYNWNPPVVTGPNATSLFSGTYSVIVTDANGCKKEFTEIVNQPDPMTIVSATTNPSCEGKSDGGITISLILGGTAPFMYTWNTASTGNSISDLAAGNYSVLVQDGKGCTGVKDFTITEPQLINVFSTTINPNCSYDKNGSIELKVSGGAIPYKFEWSNALTTKDISDLAPGNYTVVITDNQNCKATKSIELASSSSKMTVIPTIENEGCPGAADGSISLAVSGGVPEYQFAWENHISTSSKLSNIQAGTFSYTVTDMLGCKTSSTSIVGNGICTGITGSIGKVDDILIYPNPTTEKISIETDLNIKSVVIRDNLGRIVLSLKSENQIDMTDMSNGIYFMEVETDRGKSIRKISKE